MHHLKFNALWRFSRKNWYDVFACWLEALCPVKCTLSAPSAAFDFLIDLSSWHWFFFAYYIQGKVLVKFLNFLYVGKNYICQEIHFCNQRLRFAVLIEIFSILLTFFFVFIPWNWKSLTWQRSTFMFHHINFYNSKNNWIEIESSCNCNLEWAKRKSGLCMFGNAWLETA